MGSKYIFWEWHSSVNTNKKTDEAKVLELNLCQLFAVSDEINQLLKMLVLFHQEDKFTGLQNQFDQLNATISASLSEIWPPQQNAADSLVSL